MTIFYSKFKVYYRLLMALLVMCSMAGASFAQTTVSGKVSDQTGGLPGVSVSVDGTQTATTTDVDGNYSIRVENPNATLVFSYVGFATQRVAVNGRSSVNVTLAESTNQLDEVVVTGMGTTRLRGDITGSISTVGSEEISKSTSLTPELAMQGQMAGVRVTSGGADPTARPTVRIRGVGTFNNADPLYVIDGVPLVEGGAGATVDRTNDATRRGTINIYTLISPNDIESISVLKDASAAAIYGVRGANGVVLITTKRGKKGSVRVDVDVTSGTMSVPKTYDVLNSQQYVDFFTKSYNARPTSVGGVPQTMYQVTNRFGPIYDPTNINFIGDDPTYDWQGEMINKDAGIQNYNVRASGGSENTTYNFSAGIANNDGAIKGNFAKRYNVSSNITSQINKYFEAGLNLRLVNENSRVSLDAGPNAMYAGAPFQPIYDPKGPFGYASLYNINAPITRTTFSTSKRYGPEFTSIRNPLGTLAATDDKTNHQSVIGNIYLQFQPVSGLRLKGMYSGQNLDIKNAGFTHMDAWQFGETATNPVGGITEGTYVAGVPYHRVSNGMSNTLNTNVSFNANFVKTLAEKHNIDLMFDASKQEYQWSGFSASNFINNTDPMLRNFGPSPNNQGSGGIRAKYALLGYLGRATYNYSNRYYIEALVRRDGSSRFAPGNQWGTFPAAALGWRISEEKFMEGLSFLNDLKLRSSYGVLGNEATTGGWQYLTLPSASAPHYNLGSTNSNNRGVAFVSVANPTLTWEKVYNFSVGFDASMLNNSLSLTIEYFDKVTKGIIQQVPNPLSQGVRDAVDRNIADVLNRGMEFQVGYNKRFGKVGFNASANLTTLHNEVLKLADNNNAARRSVTPGATTPNLEVGRPIGFIWGWEMGGIFQNQAEVDAYKAKTQLPGLAETKPGDIWFKDINGAFAPGSTAYNVGPDGIMNDNDRTYLGNTIPKLVYGLNLGSDFMNFDLSAFFQGVGGVERYNSTRAAGEATDGYGRNRFATVLNAWTPENPSTSMPRAVYGDPNNNRRVSSRYVEDASYLRLQNLTLGYTLPASLVAKTRSLQSLRLSLTGINLFTLTPYSGLDPEVEFNTRQFLFGLRASF